MSDPGKYYGICPESGVPRSAVHSRLAYSKKVNGRLVNYYEVWVKREGTDLVSFSEDRVEKTKVNQVERQLGIKFEKRI